MHHRAQLGVWISRVAGPAGALAGPGVGQIAVVDFRSWGADCDAAPGSPSRRPGRSRSPARPRLGPAGSRSVGAPATTGTGSTVRPPPTAPAGSHRSPPATGTGLAGDPDRLTRLHRPDPGSTSSQYGSPHPAAASDHATHPHTPLTARSVATSTGTHGQSHDGSEPPPLRGSPTSSLMHEVRPVSGTHRLTAADRLELIPDGAKGSNWETRATDLHAYWQRRSSGTEALTSARHSSAVSSRPVMVHAARVIVSLSSRTTAVAGASLSLSVRVTSRDPSPEKAMPTRRPGPLDGMVSRTEPEARSTMTTLPSSRARATRVPLLAGGQIKPASPASVARTPVSRSSHISNAPLRRWTSNLPEHQREIGDLT